MGLRNKGRKETFCYMPFVLFIFLPRAFLSYKSNTFQKYIKAEKGTSVQPWKKLVRRIKMGSSKGLSLIHI